MKYESKYEKIRKLIASGDISNAISGLIEIANITDNGKVSDTGTSLQSRFNRLKEKVNRGIVGGEEESRERNKIIVSVLEELRNLEKRNNLKLYEGNSQTKAIEKQGRELRQLSEEDFFRITKTACIIIELEKIKEKFYNIGWDKRDKVLAQLLKYSSHTTVRLFEEILFFLSSIVSITRSGMNSDIAYTIELLIFHYFPYFEKGKEGKEYEDIVFQCINIGDNLFYDSAIYLNDFKVGVKGLQILKWMYWKGKRKGLENIMNKVRESYKDLEFALNRPERDDLETAKEILEVFREDLDNSGLEYPIKIPMHLLKLI